MSKAGLSPRMTDASNFAEGEGAKVLSPQGMERNRQCAP